MYLRMEDLGEGQEQLCTVKFNPQERMQGCGVERRDCVCWEGDDDLILAAMVQAQGDQLILVFPGPSQL